METVGYNESLPVKFDVYICGFYILRNVHLNALVSCNNNLASTIQFQKLRQHQAVAAPETSV